MRSVAEIQAEITQVQAELRQASLELEAFEKKASDVMKEQDTDPEWRMARRQYIDTGDMNGINAWYNRRDERKRMEIEATQKANGGKSNQELLNDYDSAYRNWKSVTQQFTDSNDKTDKAMLIGAEQKLYEAGRALRQSNLASNIMEDDTVNTDKKPADNKSGQDEIPEWIYPYSKNIAGLNTLKRALDDRLKKATTTKPKYYYADADYDSDLAYINAIRNDPKITEDVKKLADEIYDGMMSTDKKKMGLYYRESDRKKRDANNSATQNKKINDLETEIANITAEIKEEEKKVFGKDDSEIKNLKSKLDTKKAELETLKTGKKK